MRMDAVTDDIEQAGNATTKQIVQSNAKKLGVEKALDKALDAKGYRRNGGPKWKTQ